MANRITDAQLKLVCDRINKTFGLPTEPYTKTVDADGNDKWTPNPGVFHLSYAYGGVSLVRMANADGGESNVLGCGHIPKRELYALMHAFLSGGYSERARATGTFA